MRRVSTPLIAVMVVMSTVAPGSPARAQTPACSSERTKIVGGSDARLQDWPGQAVVRLYSEEGHVSLYFCGGSAIDERWVLTAAHCMHSYAAGTTAPIRDESGQQFEGKLQVVLGVADLVDGTIDSVFGVDKVIIHATYRAAIDEAHKLTSTSLVQKALDHIAENVGSDIALLRLDRSWKGPKARLSLAALSDPPPRTQVRVAGFGKTASDQKLNRYARGDGSAVLFAGSKILLETSVEAVDTPACKARYSNSVITDGQLCAGLEEGGQDSCQGDSGGPLVAYDADGCPYQVGVVSWGEGCAKAQAYGVYTRVSHYADWLQKQTGPLTGVSTASQGTTTVSQRELAEGQRHLESLLGQASGRVKVGIRGGNRVALGKEVVFEASSSIEGRLVIIDVNANSEVLVIFPNKYVTSAEAGRIAPGETITIPGQGYGFTAFKAIEPVGRGKLLALVVPPDFDVERFASIPSERVKGLVPVNEPASYFMRLIRQIEMALASGRTTGDTGDLKIWGYSVVDYEIVQ